MSYTVALPDGRSVEFPDEVSKDQAAEIIRQQLGGPQKTGLLAAAGKGLEGMLGSAQTAFGAAFGSPEEAAAAALKRQQSSEYADQVSLEKAKEAFGRGVLPGIGEVGRQIPLALAEQSPQIAAALASGAAGAAAGSVAGPVGTLIGGGIGAFTPALIQAFGSGVERQAVEQQQAGKPLAIDTGAAALAAVPSAALDVAATYIPLGRTIVGKVLGPQVDALLKKGMTEGAEQLAKESLLKVAAKGVGVGVAAEVPTEITQQMLERLQAGLPITGDEAYKEYVDTAYQAGLLAPIGAGGRLADRGAARQEVERTQQAAAAEEFKARQAAETQAAEELAAKRQTPEYAQEVAQTYAGLMQQRAALQEKVRAKIEKDDLVGLADKKDAAQALRELNSSDEFKSASEEFRRVTPVLRQLQEQQAQVQAQQALQAQQEQEVRTKESEFAGPGRQQMLPGMEEAGRLPTPEPEAEPDKALEFAQKQQELQQLLTDHQQKESEAAAQGNTEALKQLKPQRDMLRNEYDYVTKQLDLLGGYAPPGAGAAAIQKKLDKAQADLKNLSGAGYDPVVADKLVAKIDEYTTQLQKAGGVQQAFGFGTKAAPATREQTSEQLPEFASRLRQQAQAERMAGVEGVRPEVTAERAALERIGEKAKEKQSVWDEGPVRGILPGQTQDLFGAAPEQYPSAALGQMQQERTGQERTYTGEETAPPKVPQRVKGTGEFKLFPRQGAPIRPSEHADISTRLASVLARSDLTPEAYSLLRRAEKALPQTDARIEEIRSRPQPTTADIRDVASTEGMLTLLDQQLIRIERGEEGVARKGAGKPGVLQAFPVTGGRADVAPPTAPAETAPGVKTGYARAAAASEQFGPERQAVTAAEAAKTKRANLVGPETIRGPSAKAVPLSLQSELEPLVSQFERARESSQEGQLGLFEGEEKKLGAIKPDAAAFQRLLNSPFVRKLLKDIRTKEQRIYTAEKQLPELIKKIAALETHLALVEKDQADFTKASEIVKSVGDATSAFRSLAELKMAINRLVVPRMQLEGAIESQRQLVAKIRDAYPEFALLSDEDRAVVLRDMGVTGVIETTQIQVDAINKSIARLDADAKRIAANLTLDAIQSRGFGEMQDHTPAEKAALGKAYKEFSLLSQEDQKALFPVSEQQRIREELFAARRAKGVLERGASEQAREERRAEGEARRAAEARKETSQEEARIARDKAIAARTERAYGEQFGGTRYAPISEAERLRRETEGLPRITAMDQEQLLVKEGEKIRKGKKDPFRVLGGYRSTIARLEKLIKRKQDASRAFAEQDIGKLKTAYEQLDKKYKETKSAEARAAISRDLEAAETKYNNAKNAITEQRFVFKGQKAVEDQLAEAYVKEEWLADLVTKGTFETVGDKKPQKLLSKQSKEALQAQRERAFAKQKAEEGPAPATTGEALTPSQVKKARAAEKTLYSSKGVGAEDQKKLKEQQELAAEAKEARGKDALSQLAATATQGPALKEEIDVEDSAAAVMKNIAKTTTSDIARAVADKLKLLLGSTEVRIVKDLRDQNGNAVYGQAAVDGSFIALDAKYGLNETTAIHEGVHASLERILRMPESQLTDRQRAAKRELEALFDAIKNDDAIVNDNAKTDMSEFLSEALSDGALQGQLRAKPWTLKNAWEALKHGILKMLNIDTPKDMLEATLASADVLMSKVVRPTEADVTIQVVNRPRYAANLADAGRITDALVADQKSLWQTVKPNLLGLGFRTQFVDKLAPLEKIANTAMDALKGTQMMYYLRMYEQRMNFTSQSISNGVPQLVEKTRADGRKEWLIESASGATLKDVVDILKTVGNQAGSPEAASRLFTLYLAAKRAERVGINALNFGGKVTQADLDAAIKQIKTVPALEAAFERARDKYNDYNKNLLSFAVQTGSIQKSVASSLLAAKDYVPFYRVREGVAELIIGNETPIRIGSLKDSPHLQELVGGEEAIFDFLTSSVQNTSMLLDMSLKNIATKNAMYELADSKLAKIGRGAGPKNAVDFMVDGKPHYAVIDTDAIGIPSDLLVKGLAGIPTMLPTVTRIMGAPARLLRRAVTASPVYMARQIFRDSLAATMLSGADMTPILSTLKQLGKESSLTKRGVTGGQVFTGTNEDLSRLLSEMQSGRPAWSQAFSKLEAMSMEADAATRRAQYNSYIKQGLSEMEATFMALESMNFNKRGVSPSVHMVATLIPFMNAQIQGLDVMYKAFTGKMPFNERLKLREKLWTRGMVLFGMSMWYAASMQDDEAYKNATPEQKYGNWFVRIPGVEEPIRVPIPFELGYVFKAIPEAIVNTLMTEQGGEEAAKAFKQIALQIVPGGTSYGIPQAVKPLIELGLGKSFFTGREIESASEQAREPGTRYRENTSELAKQVGEITGVSPIKLEYLISSYTGSMGLALLQTLNFAMPAEGPEKAFKRLSEQPLVGTLFQPNDAGGIINATYERMNEVNQIKATFDNYVKTNQMDKARSYYKENVEKLAQASLAGSFREKMGELTSYEKAVRDSSRTASEKREMLDRVRQLKIRLATSVREAFDRTTRQ